MVLMCCACSVSAASVDSMNSTVSDVDEIDESISQIDDENADDLLSVEENDDTLKLEPSDFKANISSEVDLADEDTTLAEVYCPEGVQGEVCFILDDGNEYKRYEYKSFSNYDEIKFTLDDFLDLHEGEYGAKLVWSNNDNNMTLKEGKMNVYMTITAEDFEGDSNYFITERSGLVTTVYFFPTNGELSAFVDGKKRYSKNISDAQDGIDIFLTDLNITEDGSYELLLKFKSVSNREVTFREFVFTVELDEPAISIYDYTDIKNPEDIFALISLSEYIDGIVTVSIAGKQVFNKIISVSQEIYELDICVRDMNLENIDYGNYPVVVTYTNATGDKISESRTVNFTTVPNVYWPSNMSIGENAGLIINGDSSFSGNVIIYFAVEHYGVYSKGNIFAAAEIISGYARIPLTSLGEGTHQFFIEYALGNYHEDSDFEEDIYTIDVRENSQNFTSSISALSFTVNDQVIVNLNGSEISGNASIYLDGDLYKTVAFNGSISENISGLSAGTHYITVKYDGNDYYSKTYEVTVFPVPEDASVPQLKTIRIYDEVDIRNPDAAVARLHLDDCIDGTVTVTVSGKQVYKRQVSASQNISEFYIHVRDLNMGNIKYGNYPVEVTYTNSSGDRISDTETVKLTTIPNIYWPNDMSVGDDEGLIIKGESGISGTVTIYNAVRSGDEWESYYYRGSVFETAKITNGYARISLSKLTEGVHRFIIDCTFGNYELVNYDETYVVNVHKNSANFASSISASSLTVGNPVSVRLNGPVASGDAVIYLDGDKYRTVPFNGQITESISGLSAGTHYITVKFNDGNSYYSKTYQVNVKPVAPPAKTVIKLTLKKVIVKKSAKKLVLTATLKINKKAAKGKKITFKFNGKKYTAKTNKKGVAKVTIKKKILKKLKVGKKVKIQAKFGKTTKKLTVKVKK